MMGLISKVGGALLIVGLILYVNFSVMAPSVPSGDVRAHHELSTHMRVVAEKLQPEVNLIYSGFSLGGTGEIQLDNVQIRPAVGPDLITAERMVIRQADSIYMQELWQELAFTPLSKSWPKRASIRLEGARIELSEHNVRQLDRLFSHPIKDLNSAFVPLFTCRGYDRFSFQSLRAMGVDALTGSFDLDYALNTVGKVLRGQVQVDLNHLFAFDATVSLATEPTPAVGDAITPQPGVQNGMVKPSSPIRKTLRYLNGDKLARHPLELTELRLDYQDSGFHELRNNHCAVTLEQSAQLYLSDTASQLTEQLAAQGWRLNPESQANFSAFTAPGGVMSLELTALKPYIVSGKAARSLKPSAQLLEHFDAQLVLNNKYESLREIWAGLQLSAADRPLNLTEEEARRAAVRAAILRAVGKPVEQYQAEFRPVAPADMDPHIGKRIRLETYFGRRIEGRLSRIENDVIYVKEYMAQGSAIYPVDRTKISELEIYH